MNNWRKGERNEDSSLSLCASVHLSKAVTMNLVLTSSTKTQWQKGKAALKNGKLLAVSLPGKHVCGWAVSLMQLLIVKKGQTAVD